MKNIIFISTCFLSLISFSLFSQPCLPEGIEFTTQSQIDNFQINYPGCPEIEGDVEIDGDDISNLYGLNILTFIGGDFIIRNNDLLNSLTGIDNLAFIGGGFHLSNNDALINLIGLESVTSLGGDLYIASNDVLNSLTGLESLTIIAGSLTIGYDYIYGGNDNLTTLTGLDNLISIEGNLKIGGNDALISLNGLENIDPGSIENIKIVGNDQLGECHVQSICDYLAAPNGLVEIHENASGCNNPGEIALACGFSIPCLPYGNYYFSSQTDIDNFQINFPGCIDLEGDVYIHGNTFPSIITNLGGLNVLTSIEGNLWIHSNHSLTSLAGLNNLSFIGEDLLIWGNDDLTNLAGLEGLTSIGGNLEIGSVINENYNLINLTGFDNLDSIGGNLRIDYNPVLSSLTGLENLDYIGGSLIIGSNTYGCGTPALTSLTGLNNLVYIGENLKIINNDTLTNLIGMDNLVTIGGSFRLYGNENLSSIAGLGGLVSIGGSLQIGSMSSGQNALTNLIGLENLNYIGEQFSINSSNSINSLTGLESLESIGGSLSISGNDALTSITGIESLSSIGGSLIIGTYGQGGVPIGNQNLTSLTGLQNLTSIGDHLVILANDGLSSLTGLESLNSFGGYLYIENNSGLTNLEGLDNLDPGSIDTLRVFDNEVLSYCHVTSICDYLATPNGYIEIHDNSQGCNSQEEVEEACDSITSIPELISNNSFSIIPNPLESTTIIKYNLSLSSPATLEIIDVSGRVIITVVNEIQNQGEYEAVFNTIGLKPGIYFCVLKTSNGIQTKKTLKL